MAAARANSRPQVSERLVPLPAVRKNNTTGYKNVTFYRNEKKFVAQVRDGGKRFHLGYFDTAEEAAVAYARSEYGRADAPKLLQPRAAPTAAGAEAIRQAEREGLTLIASSDSTSGYKGVTYCPKRKGSKNYKLSVWVGGKMLSLGYYTTAEEAALARARHLWAARLLEPQPQQAPPQGAAGPSEASSYEEEAGASRGGGGEESDAEGGAPETDSPPTKRQRPFFVWTHEMHLRFERAVIQLGVPRARPLAIRRLMGCEGEEGAPTQDNIKSHLQRYRQKWKAAVAYARTAGQAGGEAGPSAPAEDGFDPADTAAAVSLAALRPAAFRERAARAARDAD